jgi:hypothetical protein
LTRSIRCADQIKGGAHLFLLHLTARKNGASWKALLGPANAPDQNRAYHRAYIAQRPSDTTQIKSVAALGGLELEIVADYKHFEDNKKPDFLAKFPHGKIPALEGPNGFNLTEGAAIARYRACSLPLTADRSMRSGKTKIIYVSVIPVLTCDVDTMWPLTPTHPFYRRL